MRPTCYRCLKPQALCLCARIERVANRTEIVVLQHPKERAHPFGTARIARLGLDRVRVEVPYAGFSENLHHPLALGPRTALLYPHRDAVPLAAAPPGTIDRLVVLDGTWSHAKRLYRDNPWLAELPHVSLAPERPSEYRIRREPDPKFVSTIEAICQSLRLLEPETAGVERLLAAFRALVDDHLATRSSGPPAPRRQMERARPFRAVPQALIERSSDDIVVAYGEFHPQRTPASPQPRSMLQWSASRLGTGERFEAFVRQPAGPPWPSPAFLAQLGLEADATPAVDVDGFCAQWRRFAGDALVAVWTRSSLDLLDRTLRAASPAVVLKTAYTNLTNRGSGTLEAVIARERLAATPTGHAGRARDRIGNGLAIAHWLRREGRARLATADGGAVAPALNP